MRLYFLFLLTLFLVFYSTQNEPLYIHSQTFTPNQSSFELNNNINSLSCDCIFYVNNIKLYGNLNIDKNKFRLILNSFLSKECDIGLNDNFFWIWIKRSGSYYANVENIYKIRLRSALNPFFIKESLGINNISTDNYTISENYIKITSNELGTNGYITKIILVDKFKKRIIANYLYENNVLIASSEIKEFKNNLPSKIIIHWYEENCKVIILLKNIKINTKLNNNLWIMPNYKSTFLMPDE